MGNGKTERFNRTLLDMLGCLTEDQKKNWKKYVSTVAHDHKNKRHESTGFSPFFLMFGRHPRLAVDVVLNLTTPEATTVLVRNVGLKGKQKLANIWKDSIYEVLEQPNEDIPVYVVQKEGSRAKKTLHRNMLLPVNFLPLDDPQTPRSTKKTTTRPKIQHSDQPTSSDEDVSESDLFQGSRPLYSLWRRILEMLSSL